MLGQHQHEGLGSGDRPNDGIGVLRARSNVTRRDPATDPTRLQSLDQSVGNGPILRGVADEYLTGHRRGSLRLRLSFVRVSRHY